MKPQRKIVLALLALIAFAPPSRAAGTKSGFITTVDDVKIHYLEAGQQHVVLSP
ncbi:MAG: hypothetical protein WBD87_15430 [Candidatus Acidiferrales bacterium]